MTRRALLAAGLVLVLASGCSSDGSQRADGSGSDAAPDAQVTFVSQNLLHGTACPPSSDRCHIADRVDLFVAQLNDAECPEVVGIQEANQRTVRELRRALPDACDGDYEIVWDDDPTLDREVILTTLPVLGSRRIHLAGPLRTAYWARVAAPVGVVDFVTAHLASSSDDRPCDRTTCPTPCEEDDTVNICQARQLVEFADDVAAPDAVVVLGGDLNAEPDEPTIAALTHAGFVDTHLAAGNAECDPDTGSECTSGRIDDAMTDLTDPSSTQSERIDYLLLGGRSGCEAIDPTGLFNTEPADGDLAFASDHTGVTATIQCPTTADQLASATTATVAPEATTTTTAAGGGTVDAATSAAITDAYTNLFDGRVTDPDVKLASLESADEIRSSFLQSFEATRDVAAGIRPRIDDITRVDDTHADVTYTLLLNGSPVLDHLPGGAVLVDGQWLVTLRTYCDVSTQGADTIPEPCR